MASLTASLEKALANYIYLSGLRTTPGTYVKRALTMLMTSAAVSAFLLYFFFFIARVPAFAIIGAMPVSYSLYMLFRPVIKAKAFESQCIRASLRRGVYDFLRGCWNTTPQVDACSGNEEA
jgi:ABC-type transport system involved in cytochrome bd biosynthesis fused ATPase/permease subunit